MRISLVKREVVDCCVGEFDMISLGAGYTTTNWEPSHHHTVGGKRKYLGSDGSPLRAETRVRVLDFVLDFTKPLLPIP